MCDKGNIRDNTPGQKCKTQPLQMTSEVIWIDANVNILNNSSIVQGKKNLTTYYCICPKEC